MCFFTAPYDGALAENMRIDGITGNVGIGETSPTNGKLQIRTSSAIGYTPSSFMPGANIRLKPGGTAATNVTVGVSMGVGGAAEAYIGAVQNASTYADIVFQTYHGAYGERMRITSWGDVSTNSMTSSGASLGYGLQLVKQSGYSQLYISSNNTSSRIIQRFYNPNGNIGNIIISGSSTAYNTTSDYRLKENVVGMTGALDRVNQLKPSRFNFIADADKTVDGFLAHEVQEIVPEAISGEKDAVDEEGNPDYQGIDQSKLVPLLVAAIQELKAEIEILKNK